MSKPHITRTLAPIHFDDLEPHRFEDLVRQLAYDFRPWKTIESTGRGGADDGFDIRAFEVVQPARPEPDEQDQDDVPHPMEGNMWMFQCKREKEIGPGKVAKIIADGVNEATSPYGYVLAAPAHFSKAAHDRFRAELMRLGVMEFFLWGAGELEDMLYQPKNDRLLFAFFGISLTTRRRSRTTELRASVSVKNKLLHALGHEPRHRTVLLRDLADVEYPYEERYSDFEKRPRWRDYTVVRFHPLGLVVSAQEEYAYYDRLQKTWDVTRAVNVARDTQRRDPEDKRLLAVKGFWELLPRRNRAMLITEALVRFDSIALVDDQGDADHKCPHIFLEFDPQRGPFAGVFQYLKLNEHHSEGIDDLSRASVFPSEFSIQSFGTIHKDQSIAVDGDVRAALRGASGDITVYDLQKRYSFLKPTDIVAIEGAKDHDGQQVLVKITSIRAMKGAELIALFENEFSLRPAIERQIGRELKAKDDVDVIEAMVIHRWQIEQNRPVI